MKRGAGASALVVAALFVGFRTGATVPSASPPATFPAVRGADVPSEPSKAPSAAEWSAGRRVAPTRGSAGICELTLVREWLKLRCPGMVGAGLVAGDPRGVSVRALGRLFIDGMPGDAAAVVVLPLRRGEARIVGFNDSVSEYNSDALGESGVLSVLWRTNRPDPVLVMRGVPTIPRRPGPGIGPE